MNPLRGEQKGPGRCPGAVLCFNMRVASDQRVCLRVGPRLHGRNPPPPGCAQQNGASDKELWRARRISTFEVPVTCGTTQRNTVAANKDAFHIVPSRRRTARKPQEGRRILHLLSS